MILTEYDEQEEREYQRAEGRAEGRALLRVSTLPLLVVFFSLICKEISRIVTTEYYVEDGVLKGPKVYIDLWNIEDVRYGSRCIFLNGVMLGYIANPKMFLDELDVIYTALTGEPLP